MMLCRHLYYCIKYAGEQYKFRKVLTNADYEKALEINRLITYIC